jgi:hypothetical protein
LFPALCAASPHARAGRQLLLRLLRAAQRRRVGLDVRGAAARRGAALQRLRRGAADSEADGSYGRRSPP